MNAMRTFSSIATAVTVAASMAMVVSTSALGTCKTTLRGELVRSPEDEARREYRVSPSKFLFFSLDETVQRSGSSREERFQYFVVPNTRTTFPIPFSLDIDSPRDCPSKLNLTVQGDDNPDFFNVIRQGNIAPLFLGMKTIRLDNYETIPVGGPTF
ncbi:hypothetical protein HL667_31620 [Bradyrhizobium sp. 83012]|uniref:Uncharacterized protein n=1 Tax=Bradyrhizobium aeschynomenes TaxID=2734909 RepID=A0ABX2CQ89_9BRAD|nr:hypothetical protein [Bradyrhizobium aeschynomenes]NPU69590.1 hypothetical protein [Bradyrhizobium aeschynomenes]